MDTLTSVLIAGVSFIMNGLLGIVVYFMRKALENAREDFIKTQAQIEHIKDTFYKKEDFRDFKVELFDRLDRMESAFERKIQEVTK
jgi:uncharacterized membrane protein YraQ (UPF0718 family)